MNINIHHGQSVSIRYEKVYTTTRVCGFFYITEITIETDKQPTIISVFGEETPIEPKIETESSIQ